MSFYINNTNPNRPGPINSNSLNGVCEKVLIEATKIFDSCVSRSTETGIILNLTKVGSVVPQISDYLSRSQAIVTPISMIIIGIKLGSIKISSIFKNKNMYFVSLCKLILVPALLVAIMLLLRLAFNVSNELILGMFVAFAMPSASLATTFADNFGGDSKSAAIFTIGTTILSVITIPVLYYLLMLII